MQTTGTQPQYVVVTPARDEARYLPAMIDAMQRQTIAPAQWVIVDDGSTDATGAIADAAARACPWLRVVHRVDRGTRQAGVGVMQAFHAGFDALDARDWDYIVKLDADLVFPSDYFARCFDEFASNPRLGIGGGVCWAPSRSGKYVEERTPRFHVRGTTKIYRRACWDDIGGLVRMTGWEIVDEAKANRLGWQTSSFPHIVVRHERPSGDAAGQWRDWVKQGRASYIAGYDPLFLLARAVARLARTPGPTSAAGLVAGYVGAGLQREPRFDDTATVRYLREQQRRKLTGRSTIWR
jgi:glycosyltransferase involved in cell wall biosynthesis